MRCRAFSLIYVSRSWLARNSAGAAIDDIVATSIERNGREDITGALLYTGSNFVQILEGPEPAVLDLMDDIRRDTRHDEVEVLEMLTDTPRMFAGWSMAYVGDATFVRAHVRDLLDARGDATGLAAAVRRMRRLMREFVHASQ